MPLYGMLLDNMPRIYMKDMFLFNINTSNQVILVTFQNTERGSADQTDSKVWENPVWWEEIQIYPCQKSALICWFACTQKADLDLIYSFQLHWLVFRIAESFGMLQ